jgi:hypothetical protein
MVDNCTVSSSEVGNTPKQIIPHLSGRMSTDSSNNVKRRTGFITELQEG